MSVAPLLLERPSGVMSLTQSEVSTDRSGRLKKMDKIAQTTLKHPNTRNAAVLRTSPTRDDLTQDDLTAIGVIGLLAFAGLISLFLGLKVALVFLFVAMFSWVPCGETPT